MVAGMNQLRTTILATTAATVLVCLPYSAARGQNGTPQKIDIANLPAETIGQVIIPIPQEVFASLDKLGSRNWRGQIKDHKIELNSDRSRTALLFGLVIADGFIAVQAENRNGVVNIGRDVQRLAVALGVRNEVDGHALAIVDGAGDADWKSVRRELDRARQTVIDTMKKLQDDELADLVSIGGWLGGTRALSALLAEDYSAEGAELLHQPDLVNQIAQRYEALPAATKPGPVYSGVKNTLRSLSPLMRIEAGGDISKESVETILKLTADLTQKIYGS